MPIVEYPSARAGGIRVEQLRGERRFQFSSQHAGGLHFAFVDGHVQFISENTDVTLLRAMTTRSGQETNDHF